MIIKIFTIFVFFVLFQQTLCVIPAGTNVAGPEFDSGSYWPGLRDISYFTNKGLCLLRLPFKWERLQPNLMQNFDQNYFNALNKFVVDATANGAQVIIDPHNYARYNGKIIGSEIAVSNFNNLWTRLANLYKNNSRVIFGLMNEPNTMSTSVWLSNANSAIDAIRSTGANNLILVPGNAWTGAHSWLQNWYGEPNGNIMKGIIDRKNNFAFEVHQYFDWDKSGRSEICSTQRGSDYLREFTNWCKVNKYKAFLGEFAGGNNMNCRDCVIDALRYMNENQDVWIGWTWWAAGTQWNEYIYTLQPTNNYANDRAQMGWINPAFSNPSCKNLPTLSTYYTAQGVTADGTETNQNETLSDANPGNILIFSLLLSLIFMIIV